MFTSIKAKKNHPFLTFFIVCLAMIFVLSKLWDMRAMFRRYYRNVEGVTTGVKDEVLFNKVVRYDNFESYSSLADLNVRAEISPDNKKVFFHDIKVRPARSYVIDLETQQETLLHEGDVNKYGWVDSETVQLDIGSVYPKNSSSRRYVNFDAETASSSTTTSITPSLVEINDWCISTFCIKGEDQQKRFYAPDHKYYFVMRYGQQCTLDCNPIIEAIDFYQENGEKYGEYVFPTNRDNWSGTAIGDNWTTDDGFVIFERTALSNAMTEKGDVLLQDTTGVSDPIFMQRWLVRKLSPVVKN